MRNFEQSVSEESAVPGVSARELSDLTASVPNPDDLVLVQQHLKDEVDVNTIVKRFGITGNLPLGPDTGVYGDFTGISDFESAVERISGARERFMRLPASVRERFGNDPGQLIRMAQELPEEEFNRRITPDPEPAPAPGAV